MGYGYLLDKPWVLLSRLEMSPADYHDLGSSLRRKWVIKKICVLLPTACIELEKPSQLLCGFECSDPEICVNIVSVKLWVEGGIVDKI